MRGSSSANSFTVAGLLPILLGAVLLIGSIPQVLAQGASASLTVVREADLEEPETISDAAGLTFSPQARRLLVLGPGASGAQAVALDLIAEVPCMILDLPAAVSDLINVTFDAKGRRWLMLNAQSDLLTMIAADPDGSPKLKRQRRQDVRGWGLVEPAGLTVAPASDGGGAKHIYIVDRGVDPVNDGSLYEMTLPQAGAPEGGRQSSRSPGVAHSRFQVALKGFETRQRS
jgi:hypothetical protein